MVTEARKKANAKYDSSHTKGLYLKLNTGTDADILEYLETITAEEGGKQGYIKNLIRRDMTQKGQQEAKPHP